MHPSEVPLSTPLRNTPRIELKYSGALRKHVRGYWKNILGGIEKNMQNTLGYESAPRIEKKCSGENILGLGGD
jgi:hypothetical protein